MTQQKRRRTKVVLWLSLTALCVFVAVIPIQTGSTRAILLFGSFAAWALGLFLFWRTLLLRLVFLLPLVAVIGVVLLPYRIADTVALRVAYVKALRSYEGVPYLWGGESRMGIDCSGLVRRGLIDAAFSEGWRTQDLGLLRTGLALWWYDTSAKAMGEGYQGRTHLLGLADSLNDADYGLLLPGDLAVTEDGRHVLTFLGDKTWIEAEPRAGRVILQTAPSNDLWFTTHMRLMRWYRF